MVEEDDQSVLIGTLQKALKDEQFKLLFQPIISLRGDDTERYEVLLRMLNDAGEEIPPIHFMQAAVSIPLLIHI